MRNIFGGLPAATKVVTATYLVLSLTTMTLRYLGAQDRPDADELTLAIEDPAWFLVLRPGYVVRRPWTLLTGPLTEPNPLFAICGVLTLVTVGSFLERQWGSRGYVAFMAIVAAVPALTAAIAVVLLAAIRGKAELLYTTQIGGLAGIVSGFCVGLKQLVPDYSVKLLRGAVGFRVNDVPGVYTLVAPILFSLLGDLGGVLLVNIGFVEAFIYLRFYRRSGAVRGDRSDAFAFCTFFPDLVQPVVRRISNGVYSAAVACNLVASEEGYQQAVDLEAGVGTMQRTVETHAEDDAEQSGREDTDADRRRAIAAKALEMRLNAETPASSTASPLPDETEPTKPATS
ncbi:hypothetical protein GGF46_003078 [Coemansia sp. RSA 552]|nr:hypothetical protein GGF46_003078 [Coemansia sp. RSA 552]